jgi:hypothetical protein
MSANRDEQKDPQRAFDAVRAAVAGGGAARAIGPAVALFEAGGKHLLDEGAKTAVRGIAEKSAESALALATGPLLGPATVFAKKPVLALANAGKAARAAAPVAARAAGREILKGAGRASAIGFVLDGALASVEAVSAVRAGTIARKEAAGYVAIEAATGAAATGAGVLLGATLVALTGGVAAPVVFAVGALGSIGTKQLLRRLTSRVPALTVRELTPKAG